MNRQGEARAVLVAVSLTAVLSLSSTVRAEEAKPPGSCRAAQQNSVVRKYCASCHSDALMYGGLSLEHFDAAHPEPSVAAMLVSKLTRRTFAQGG